MKKTTKKKRNPTPAQLRARAKFVKMVRARAAAKRRGNPRKKALPGVSAKGQRQYEAIKKSVRKSGRSLKESKRIAAATVRKRASNKTIIKAKRVKILATNGRRRKNAVALPALGSSLKAQYDPVTLRNLRDKLRSNIMHYQGLTRALTKQLKTEKDSGRAQELKKQLGEIDRLEAREVSQLDRILTMIGASKGVFKRKRNPRVSPKSRQNFERFHGRPSRKTRTLSAPDGTPKSLAITGPLHKLITRKVVVPFYKMRKRNPGGQVFLAESDNGGLHIVAEGMGLPIGPPNTDFGAIEKVEYDMPDGKPHLGYQEPTGFVHKFGEEGGQKPHLETNEKGEYLITGGDYYITERGIENPGRRRTKRRIYR